MMCCLCIYVFNCLQFLSFSKLHIHLQRCASELQTQVLYLSMRNKLFHHLLQRVLVIHDHLAQSGVFPVAAEHQKQHQGPVQSRAAARQRVGSPGPVRHLVGVVVQADDGLPLLDAGQDGHQGRVGHHQVQVVLGEVKVHRLTGIQGDIVML